MSNFCRTVQLLEPDGDVTVGIAGERDESLEEQGKVNLANGQNEVVITFNTPKFSDDYEIYCYVENLVDAFPTVVQWQPQAKSKYGCRIALAPSVDSDNYVFYWHVRVRDSATAQESVIDAPEAARTTLIPGQTAQNIQFSNPRSSTGYGFSEFRVENLVDGDSAFSVWVQIKHKETTSFDITINPPVDTANYVLCWRVAP